MWDISRCIFFFLTPLERDWWRKMKTTTYQQLLRRVNWSFSSTFNTNSSNVSSPSCRSTARKLNMFAICCTFRSFLCSLVWFKRPSVVPLSLVFICHDIKQRTFAVKCTSCRGEAEWPSLPQRGSIWVPHLHYRPGTYRAPWVNESNHQNLNLTKQKKKEMRAGLKWLNCTSGVYDWTVWMRYVQGLLILVMYKITICSVMVCVILAPLLHHSQELSC